MKKLQLAVIVIFAILCLALVGCDGKGGDAVNDVVSLTTIRSEIGDAFDALPVAEDLSIDADRGKITFSVTSGVAEIDLSAIRVPSAEVEILNEAGESVSVLALKDGVNSFTLTAKKGTLGLTYTLKITKAAGSSDPQNPEDPGHTHAFGEWDVVTPATCETAGLKKRVCSCGEEETEELPALNHDYRFDSFVWDGFTAQAKCVCSRDPSHEAFFDAEMASEVLSGSCESSGVRRHIASYDGHTDSKEESLEALGHSPSDWITTLPATCTDKGSRHKICSLCEIELETEELPALNHDYVPAVTEPTCTDGGYTTFTCSRCGDQYTGDPTAAKGHTEATDAAVSATCEKTGLTEGKHCSVCGATLLSQQETPALGHSWEWVTDTPAAERVPGVQHEECSVCKVKRNENTPIEALPCSHARTEERYSLTRESLTRAEFLTETLCLDCEEIVASDVNEVTFPAETFSFDGAPHSLHLSIEKPMPFGFTFAYEGNGQTAPGDHIVSVQILNDLNEPVGAPFFQTMHIIKDGAYHEVTFLYDDESTSNVILSVQDGAVISEEALPSIPEKLGYAGLWLYEGEAITEDRDISVYYDLVEYSITYVLPEESANSISNPASYTIESETITLRAPQSNEGLTFQGWYLTEDFAADSRISSIPARSTGDKVLYGKFLRYRVEAADGFVLDNDHYEYPTLKQTVASSRKTIALSSTILVSDGCTWTLSRDIEGLEPIKTKNMSLSEGHNYAYITVYYGESDYNLVYYLDIYRLGYRLFAYRVDGVVSDFEFDIEEQGFLSAPFAPSKEGYTFVGWHSTDSEKEFITFPYQVCADDIEDEEVRLAHSQKGYVCYIDAVFKPNSYSVSFDPAGGSVEKSAVSATFDSAASFADPIRTGYTFLGWEDEDHTAWTNGSIWKYARPVQMTALWTPTVYNISYWSEGGVNTPSNPHTYTIESEEITFAALTRGGYTFCGWFTDELFSAPVIGIAAGSYGEVEVYAKWIKVELAKNIAAAGTISSLTESYIPGEEVTVTAETNAGYTWLGWFDGDEKVSEGDSLAYAFTMPAENKTFTAKWTYYTLSTQTNIAEAGTYTQKSEVKTTANTEVTLTASTNAGYTWLGWFDGDEKVSEGDSLTYTFDMPAENKTFTAKWTYYTLSTQTNIAEAGTYTKQSEVKTTANTEVTLTASTNAGYTWLGWFDGDEKVSEGDSLIYTFDMPAENKTFTAKWIKIELAKNIAAAGTISSLTETYIHGEEIMVTAETNVGYTWLGWFDGDTKVSESDRLT